MMEQNSLLKEEEKKENDETQTKEKDSFLENEKEKENFQLKIEDSLTEKEKEKQDIPEEEHHSKEDSIERSGSIRESSGSNSYKNRNNSVQNNMRNSETDLDKIIAGKEEGRLDSNSNIDYKENQRKTEASKSVKPILNFGNILSNFNISRTMSKKERRTLFKNIIDEKNRDSKLTDIINARLNDLKDSTLSYFLQIVKEFENRYKEYINKLCNYIKNNELKINRVFQHNVEGEENILEYTENNIFQQIENLLEIHENIFDALEDHISLLGIFLETPDLIRQKNPLEFFINSYSNNILECWFLNKVNFQKLNLRSFESNKDLSELYSKFLIKKKNNNLSNFSITQDDKGNLSTGSDFIKQNLKNLEKLKFTEVKLEQINNIFKPIKKDEDIIASKLKSLSIIKSDFSSKDLNKINSPSLKKIKIKRVILPLSLSSFFNSLSFKSSYLQYLYLQKCFIDDESLFQIFKYISEQPKLLESLQNISFLGNEISSVNMGSLIDKNCEFKNLEILDFSKNNIFEFEIGNFKKLYKIKALDLSDNNLTNYTFFEGIENQKKILCIFFLSNNMFLNNNKKNRNRYIKYLHQKLENHNSKLKKINLSFLYDKESKPILLQLKLPPLLKISLKKLNLSFCGLDNDIVCKFLSNNFGLLNLGILNLSNNFLELKFFELIKTVDLSLEKLTCIDLSLNEIHSMTIEDYKNIELFINKHPNLKKIKMQETVFLQDLLVLSQNEPDKIDEINKNIISREVKFVVEKDNSLMVEPMKELFEIKDKEM